MSSMKVLQSLPDFEVSAADLVVTAQLLLTRKTQLKKLADRKNYEVSGLMAHGFSTYDDAEKALTRINAIAGTLLKQALELDANEITALELLSGLYKDRLEFESALLCDQMAISLQPNSKELRISEIKSLLALERFDEAVDVVALEKNLPKESIECIQLPSFSEWGEKISGSMREINQCKPFIYPFTAIFNGKTFLVDHSVEQNPLPVVHAQDVTVIDGFVPRKGDFSYIFEYGHDVLVGRSDAVWDNAFIHKKNKETTVIEEPCIYLTGVEWHYQNYYHALAQNFPRLALLLENPEYADYRVAVPAAIRSWGIAFLAEMGVSEDKLILLPNRVNSVLRNAVIPEMRRVASRDEIQAMRRRLAVHTQQQGTRRFFIGRRTLPSHGRLLVNEEEIAAIALEFNFEEVDTVGMSIREQIDLFSQAEAICGPNGAAFANLIYAPENTAVICMSPKETIGSWYPDLAAQCGQNFYWCFGNFLPEGSGSRLLPKLPYFINPADFRKSLEIAVKRSS